MRRIVDATDCCELDFVEKTEQSTLQSRLHELEWISLVRSTALPP